MKSLTALFCPEDNRKVQVPPVHQTELTLAFMLSVTRKSILSVSIACILGLAVSATCAGRQLPKALILTGNGNVPEVQEGYPPWIHEFHNQMVSDILQDIVVTEVTSDLNKLNSDTLREYDLIISNSMFLMPDDEQLEALYRFIYDGKSLLTLHAGILSFLNWERYEKIMGGIFIGGPSTEPESFNVSTTNMEFWGYDYSFRETSEHPISKAVDDFHIEDELYYFQPSKSDFFVIARANNHPVMWWHPVGEGKVMSFTLGHSERAKQNEGYQQLLQNGVRWLLGYPLIESVILKPLSTRTQTYPVYLQMTDIVYAESTEGLTYTLKESSDNITVNLDQTGDLNVELSGKSGTSFVSVRATNEQGLSTERKFDIKIIGDGEGNIASYHGNKATASSTESKNYLFDVNHVIDGDLTTRWASYFVDPSWIQIDLQKPYPVGRIVLQWEDSFATNYSVQISETGNSWETVADVKDGDGETDTITFTPGPARFIKIIGTERARENYGYSLFEIEVYRD